MGSDKIQTYILYKLKTQNSKLFDTVSIQYQHSVKFQDVNVNTISTQHQSLTTAEILLMFFCHLLTFFNGQDQF